MCPSSSQVTSVCPVRSISNWMRHLTVTSAFVESPSNSNRTGTPALVQTPNPRLIASMNAGWKFAACVGGGHHPKRGGRRLSGGCAPRPPPDFYTEEKPPHTPHSHKI